jgi:uncharacterized protein (DUF2267 family)
MRFATFVTTVEQAAGVAPTEAERAARAVLQTLSERLTGGEAGDIALFLPEELRQLLTSAPEPAEAFGADEFVRRVAQREGVDDATAREHTRAVFVALGAAVAPGELRDMAAQLPRDFEPFLAAAGIGRERAADTARLVGRAAELAGIDFDQAFRATEAVLQTLAVRISAGEVADLMDQVPADLLPALERGLEESRPAKSMSVDDFVARVAELEGVGRAEAERHARAVFAALRDAIEGDEFADMASELSSDYSLLLAG